MPHSACKAPVISRLMLLSFLECGPAFPLSGPGPHVAVMRITYRPLLLFTALNWANIIYNDCGIQYTLMLLARCSIRLTGLN